MKTHGMRLWASGIGACLLACTFALHADEAKSTDDPYRFLPLEKVGKSFELDLHYLRSGFLEANKSFSYTAGSEQLFRDRVDGLLRRSGLSFPRFVMGVASAVAAVDDGHTLADVHRHVRHWPIRVAWFGDELRIVRARREHARLLGGEVLTIADRAPRDLLAVLGDYVGGSQERVRAASPDYLDSPDALEGMNVAADADRIAISVRLHDGTVVREVLEGVYSKQPRATLTGWRDVIPSHALRDEEEGWMHVLDGVQQLPVYLQDGNTLYQQVELPNASDVFYVRLRITLDADIYLKKYMESESDGKHLALREYLLRKISEATRRTSRYSDAIVDLRFNPGGNMMNTLDFARALPRIIAPNGRIFVLTNNQTFSAAIVTTAWLKSFGGDRTVIVGERLGDRERFWAESDMLVLPYSQIPVFATQGYHDWGKGCTIVPDCWFNIAHDVAVGSLDPDVKVAARFDDYLRGRDTILETALGLIRERTSALAAE